MIARFVVPCCVFSAVLALWPASATAQVVVGGGTRVFGPAPAGTLASDGPAYVSTGRAWHGGQYSYQPSYAYGYGGPWGYGGWGYGGWGWRYGGWGYRGWGYGPYGGWYRPYYRPAPLVLPPIVIGAEQIFGPAAAARMLGVELFAPAPIGQGGFVPLRPEAIAARAEVARADREEKPFVSNAAARQRAAKFMELGDGYFAEGNYVLAYDRYKSAVQATPDLVEPYLRRGQALIALQSYDLASTTYLHAFKLHPNWAKTAFRLDTVYGNRQREKQEHLDALAAAAERQPTAEMMFLVAAQLLYDGQAERSLRFFNRAKELPRKEQLPLPVVDEKKDVLNAQPVAAPQPAVKQPARDQPAVF